jgi:hypothetical protein
LFDTLVRFIKDGLRTVLAVDLIVAINVAPPRHPPGPSVAGDAPRAARRNS